MFWRRRIKFRIKSDEYTPVEAVLDAIRQALLRVMESEDAKGQWHLTHGQRAQSYLKPAVADHVQTYKGIIEGELHG